VAEQRARGMSELARLRQNASQARSSADELRKQMSQRRARLQQVQRGIDLATVRAPISGSVLNTNLRHAGQVLQPGEVMAVLAPLGTRFDVKLQVPADRISRTIGHPQGVRLSHSRIRCAAGTGGEHFGRHDPIGDASRSGRVCSRCLPGAAASRTDRPARAPGQLPAAPRHGGERGCGDTPHHGSDVPAQQTASQRVI